VRGHTIRIARGMRDLPGCGKLMKNKVGYERPEVDHELIAFLVRGVEGAFGPIHGWIITWNRFLTSGMRACVLLHTRSVP
jgi:hypothetical protein